jgi:hypothetical protein
MNKQVIAQMTIDGFHNYPLAPKKVNFLQFNHRHQFKIKLAYKVEGLDREKEIFIARDEIINYINESYGVPAKFGSMSCEMIAMEILEFGLDDGVVWVEVWEEETGGARVEV